MPQADPPDGVREALFTASVWFRIIRHQDLGMAIRGPQDVAAALGMAVERISKSLILKAASRKFVMVSMRVSDRANLHAVSALVGGGKYAMASPADLKAVCGYLRGGVSPIGVKDIPIFLDDGLRHHETILVGGGAPGIEIELAPADLGLVCGGKWVRLRAE